jgi:hypothetical protein
MSSDKPATKNRLLAEAGGTQWRTAWQGKHNLGAYIGSGNLQAVLIDII